LALAKEKVTNVQLAGTFSYRTHTSQIFHHNGVNKPLSRELEMIPRNRQKMYATSHIKSLQTKSILKNKTIIKCCSLWLQCNCKATALWRHATRCATFAAILQQKPQSAND